MADTPSQATKPASENEVETKKKGSENEEKRLVSWAVRPSESHPGMGEVRLEGPPSLGASPVVFFFDPMVGYDLSDKLLTVCAELKNGDG